MIYERSAGVLIYREIKGFREYLILHYPGGHFEFAKGHMEKGETERETAERELHEETGIKKFEWVDGYREKINYKYRRKKDVMNKDVIFFLAKTDTKEVKLSFEHQGSMWLPYGKAHRKLTFNNAKNLLEKAEKHLGKVA